MAKINKEVSVQNEQLDLEAGADGAQMTPSSEFKEAGRGGGKETAPSKLKTSKTTAEQAIDLNYTGKGRKLGAMASICKPSKTTAEETIDQNHGCNGNDGLDPMIFLELDIMPLPTLTRNQRPHSLPGAYALQGFYASATSEITSEIEAEAIPASSNINTQEFLLADESAGSLATAVPVAGDEHLRLPRAQEWMTPEANGDGSEAERRSKTFKKQLTYGCVVFMAVTVLFLVGFVVYFKDSASCPEDMASEPQGGTSDPNEYLISLLPNSTVNALCNPDSPQAKAFDWMAGDPNLKTLPSWRVVQRFALSTFYHATSSEEGWVRSDNWMSYDVHECDWYHSDFEEVTGGLYDPSTFEGSICGGDTSEEYKDILLIMNGLNGILPPELTLLSNLEVISLRGNQLRGEISSNIGEFQRLCALDLSSNAYTGTIPSEIGKCTDLDGIFLFYNQLTGHIPLEITGLSSLIFLVIDDNQISGNLPSELGSMPSLETFVASRNKLSGTIPTELGNLPLKQFILHTNPISGSLPSEIGMLTNTAQLLFGDMETSGTVPSEIGKMTKLELLTLYNSGLSGTIPTEFGQLSNAKAILLSHNGISGTIPAEFQSLSSIVGLLLDGNNITGTIPADLGTRDSLVALRLDHNAISGPIPSELGLLQNLEFLALSSNSLTGPIPTELGMAKSIQELQLDHNLLTGKLPSSLSQLFAKAFSFISLLEGRALEPLKSVTLPNKSLNLGANKFVGSLPTEFGLMTHLHHLSLQANSLSGLLPTELGQLRWLYEIAISHNQFSGSIPTELTELTHLSSLQAVGNNLLSGTVPKTVCALPLLGFDCTDQLCGCSCAC